MNDVGEAVRIAGLTKAFGSIRALDGVSLTVGAGEIYGLLGPNGAGKTTLIRSLVGLVTADAGTITVLGRRLPDRAVLAEVGYMPQAPALYADLTVEENVRFFASVHDLDRNAGARSSAPSCGSGSPRCPARARPSSSPATSWTRRSAADAWGSCALAGCSPRAPPRSCGGWPASSGSRTPSWCSRRASRERAPRRRDQPPDPPAVPPRPAHPDAPLRRADHPARL